MQLLLVEDDNHLAEVLASGLAEHGIICSRASTYADGLRRAGAGPFDIIVLDVMLPGGDGFALCHELRRRGVAHPIMMLTARDTVDDRVNGLEVGADDYLTKPFAFREFLARIHALARRGPRLLAGPVVVADLSVVRASRRVQRGVTPIELTAKEFALLECFLDHVDEVIDRSVISSRVWDDNHDPFTNVLEVLIRRLRRKIDENFEPKLIHTIRGAGYRFGP